MAPVIGEGMVKVVVTRLLLRLLLSANLWVMVEVEKRTETIKMMTVVIPEMILC